MKLTDNEQKSLEVFQAGMDCANEGWLHEMDYALPVEGKALSGVISSMVKKGIIRTNNYEEEYDLGTGDMIWIDVNEAFQKEESN